MFAEENISTVDFVPESLSPSQLAHWILRDYANAFWGVDHEDEILYEVISDDYLNAAIQISEETDLIRLDRKDSIIELTFYGESSKFVFDMPGIGLFDLTFEMLADAFETAEVRGFVLH